MLEDAQVLEPFASGARDAFFSAMGADRQIRAAFVVGFAAGLATAGVSVLTAVATRRATTRGRRREPFRFIDLEPTDEITIKARPAEEANTCEEPPRLESEAPEFSPKSQRW